MCDEAPRGARAWDGCGHRVRAGALCCTPPVVDASPPTLLAPATRSSMATQASTSDSHAALRNLSYDVVRGGRPPIPMVLETKPGACDLFSPGFCTRFAQNHYPNAPIDAPLLKMIIEATRGCGARQAYNRPCYAIDVGANIGFVTATLLQQGATVEAYEPQGDLATALRRTVALNGWESRAAVTHAAIVTTAENAGKTLQLGGGCLLCKHVKTNNWETDKEAPIKGKSGVIQGDVHPWRADNSHFHRVEMLTAPTVLLPWTRPHYQLVKVDTDSVDAEILERIILPRLESNQTAIDWLLVETVTPPLVSRLQHVGYHVGFLKTQHLNYSASARLEERKLIRSGKVLPLWILDESTQDPALLAEAWPDGAAALNMVAWHTRVSHVGRSGRADLIRYRA